MNRRDAFKAMTLAAGGSLLIPAFFSSCNWETYEPVFFTEDEIPLLNEIGETILPETESSPGAKAAGVAYFMDKYVADCYAPENQQIMREGLMSFQALCEEKNGKPFLKLSPEQKHDWLVKLDKEAKESDSVHYFSLVKGLVLFGYFTSQEGATKALRYLPVPGKYDGNYPYNLGDKAWAIG